LPTDFAGNTGTLAAALAAALAGRYRLERELGTGGMATVYLAEDVRHHRKVSLKVLRPELSAVIGPDRFLKEIELTASLQHPHILPLFDSGSAEGQLYHVMPYIQGETLRARLDRESQLPIPDAVRISTEIADALAYAHAHGVIHRDIKPENILLQNGHVLVADFGIALAVQQAGGERLTQTGLSLGTPRYMAPEQAMGERPVDQRADIYALGAVTYEMIAGEPPFTGPSAQAIVARIMTERPRPLGALRDTVPSHVEDAVHTALEKLPADRFASAADFAASLRAPAASESAATSAARTSRAARGAAAQRSDRRVARLPAVMLAAGMLAAGLVTGTFLSHPQAAAPESVRFSFEPDSGYLRRGAPAISPDGRTIVYAMEGADGARLYVRRVEELAAHPLPGTEGGEKPFFSPDGAWVAFHAEGMIKKTRLDGGAPTVVTTVPRGQFNAGWWGANDVILFSVWYYGDLYRVSASGGTTTRIFAGDTTVRIADARPLPGGRAALVTVTRDWNAARIGVLDLATSRLHLLGSGMGARYAAGQLIYVNAEGRLFRQPFDTHRLAPSGTAEEVADHIEVVDVVPSFDVSPTGALVYRYGDSESRKLSLVDRTGREQWVFEGRGIWAPRLSPNGRRVAYGAFAPGRDAPDAWIAEPAAGTTVRLTTDASDVNDPQWTPDGRSIVVSARRGDSRSEKDLFVQSLDGGPPHLLLRRPGSQWPSDVSRDGRALLFTDMTAAGEQSIWVQPMDGGAPRSYLTGAFRQAGARISPDGRWVSYTSDETGQSEVYVQSYPTPGRKTLVSVKGGVDGVWRADGRELYYWHGDELVAASLAAGRPGEPLAVRGRTSLFRAVYVQGPQPNYDVSADGTRFVLVMGTLAGRLVVGLHLIDAPSATAAGRH